MRNLLNPTLPVYGRIVAAALLASIWLQGCSAISSLFGKSQPSTSLKSLAVMADGQANRNSATAVDVLFVYDSSVLSLLPANAPAWFSQKSGLENTLGHSVDVVSLQIPPAYRVASVGMPARYRRALRILVYANYLAQAGQAPLDLTGYQHAMLTLLADSIECCGA
jgi:type VI secretion system protein